MSTHIKRMEQEEKELNEKIEKAFEFLEKEKSKPIFTDEIQRKFLSQQLNHMIGYREVLRFRIEYDRNK